MQSPASSPRPACHLPPTPPAALPAIFPPPGGYHGGAARGPALRGALRPCLGHRHRTDPSGTFHGFGLPTRGGNPRPPGVTAARFVRRRRPPAPQRSPAAGRRPRGTQRWPTTGPDMPQRRPMPPGPGAVEPHRHPIVLQPEKTSLCSAPSPLLSNLSPPPRLPSGPFQCSIRHPSEGPTRGKREGVPGWVKAHSSSRSRLG